MRVAIGTLIVCFAFGTAAAAAEPGDKVTRTPDGKITIESVSMAPNSCYSAGEVKLGAPSESTSVLHAILITQEMAFHEGVCLQVLTPVKFAFTTDLPENANAIVIYSTSKKNKSVSARAVAIPGK